MGNSMFILSVLVFRPSAPSHMQASFSTPQLISAVLFKHIYFSDLSHVRIQRGGAGDPDPPPPLKNHKNIGFLGTAPDPLKNYKATKPAFNVGPTTARQRNAILITFRWRADEGPLIVVLGSFLTSLN